MGLNASLPQALGSWGYLTGIEMSLSWRYGFGGRSRSLIGAGCPAAKGVPGAVFPVVRTTFGLVWALRDCGSEIVYFGHQGLTL